MQVAGHGIDEPARLNLTNFERLEIRVRLGVDLN
jgi:hypothetical protein